MRLFTQTVARIKNPKTKLLDKDFSYNAFSYFILAVFLGAGLALQSAFSGPIETNHLIAIALGVMAAAGFLTILPMWITVIQMVVILWIALLAWQGTGFIFIASSLTLGFILSPAIELVYQWDKVITLRLGRFRKVHGPGLFFLLPLCDRVADFVDTRIRATDFSAEKTLTRDTVPVHVDALAFWMIWDAQRAVLEVENFLEAVTLSAQTALRDSIGKHDLSSLLSERETLGREIQEILDRKTNPWGITILSVEFTDVVIPRELEDAMSKQAQAERERQSRVILGTAEVEIAEKFEEASRRYVNNPTALHLRAMNMVYEGLRQNGSLVLLPSSALETMNLGTVTGAAALSATQREKGRTENAEKEDPDDSNR